MLAGVFQIDRVARFASKPAPTLDRERTQNLYWKKTKCGSGLAREGSDAV
jgi:hypothetical protein